MTKNSISKIKKMRWEIKRELLNFTPPSSGDYYFYTVATDTHGIVEGIPASNDAHTTVTDNIEPIVTPVSPLPGHIVSNNDTLTLNVSAYDMGGAGMASVSVDISSINNSTPLLLNNNSGYWTNSTMVNTTNTGILALVINATDNVGNSNISMSFTVNKDDTQPIVTPVSPLPGQIVSNNDTLTLNVSAYDMGGAGMASVSVDISSINSSTPLLLNNNSGYWTNSTVVNTTNTGILTLAIQATDNVGNSNTSMSFTIYKPNSTHYVSNGESIQSSIDNASVDDMIIVNSGLYKENIVVDKKLILCGNDTGAGLPVVDAMQNGNPAITLQSDGNALEGVIATNTTGGVAGIYIASSNNIIKSTTAHSNDIGIKIASGASNNTLYENILYNNTNVNAKDDDGLNAWNSSSLGNYYDTIAVHDIDGNGINDSSYLISGNGSSIDYFPLVIASTAVSPATVSGKDRITFSINTSIIDHAHVGISTIALYYKKDNETWTHFGDSASGIFTFSTSSSGTYYFYTIATDKANKTEEVPDKDDSNTTVTTSSESNTGRVGSGSSGGGGGGSAEPPGNIKDSTSDRVFLKENNPAVYKFENVIVDSIELTPLGNYGTVTAKVEVLNSRPSSISDDNLPGGVRYQYLNIYVGSSGWADSKISDPVINFNVPKSWIEENTIDPPTVIMYRYHDEEWQRLKTTLKGQDGEYYHYSSQTPGFSTFMIAADTVKHEDVSKTDTVKNNVTDNASTAPSAQDFEKTEKAPAKGTPGFGILLAVTGISIAFYSRKR